MLIGIIFAVMVAIFWSFGEINYSRLARSVDKANVYFYQYLIRATLYLTVAIIFNIEVFLHFSFDTLLVFLPVILCDLFSSLAINIAVSNGKLSVVSPIMAAYPIVDIFLGLILLKEKIGAIEIVLSIIITLSIVVLAKNQKKSESSPHPIKGIIFATIYMLLVATSIFCEKSAYVGNYSFTDLYFYKGLIYLFTSGVFVLLIGVTPIKLKKPSLKILKGAGITPLGNISNSFALSFGNMVIVTPISSMYSVLTHFLSRKVLKEKVTFKESVCIGLILLGTIALITFSFL